MENQNKRPYYINQITPEQIDFLEKEFLKVKILHDTDLELLAAEMFLEEKYVRVSRVYF